MSSTKYFLIGLYAFRNIEELEMAKTVCDFSIIFSK